MEYPCEIIQDLIPVYIRGESSGKTTEVIDQHVRKCRECADYYCWMFELMAQDVEETERQEGRSVFRMMKKGLTWIQEPVRKLLRLLTVWMVAL